MPDAAFHGQAVDRAAGRAAQTLLILATSTSLMSVLQRGDRLGASTRVGRPFRLGVEWGAMIGGGSKPQPGEVVALFLSSKRKWAAAVVTDVVRGRPGSWLVRKPVALGRRAGRVPAAVDGGVSPPPANNPITHRPHTRGDAHAGAGPLAS